MSELLDLLLAGMDQPQADQPTVWLKVSLPFVNSFELKYISLQECTSSLPAYMLTLGRMASSQVVH
eukprot:967404-Pelagomonas_calceolata.AAC.1